MELLLIVVAGRIYTSYIVTIQRENFYCIKKVLKRLSEDTILTEARK